MDQKTSEAWHQVGQQLHDLGKSLAEAFRTAWEDEENRQHIQSMQTGLQKMVDDVGQALKEAGESPEGQKIKQETKKAAESARVAGKKVWKDTRPHIVSALRSVDTEIQKLIDQMESAEQE
jgi:hypothetical protein